jgi:hypothetical protein
MVPPDLAQLLGPDTGGPVGPDALVGGPPGSGLEDTGGPAGPDALVGGPDTGGPPGPDNLVGGPGAAPSGPPAPAGGQPGVAEDPDFTRLIKTAIDALRQAASTGEDDQDKALAAECMSKLQGLLGTHQKQQESALGMTDVHRGVRRTMRGAAGGGPAL